MDGAELMLDVRSTFFYYATGITPAMANCGSFGGKAPPSLVIAHSSYF
jgi:hypothetical protein